MRTKTLLIAAAAALAAGIISSQAQVYSQNIVGYVNSPLKSGYNNIANPLDASGGNSLTNLYPGLITGQYDGSSIYVWNGSGYTTYTADSSLGGVADGGDNFAVTPPVINPGQSFFFQSSAPSNTVTLAGTVHVDGVATGTNTVGFNTNQLGGLKFVSSKTPVGGGLGSALQLPAKSGALDGASVYVPIISGGNINGFTSYTIDSSFASGFADGGDNFDAGEPIIPVGTGFFINSASFKWVQQY